MDLLECDAKRILADRGIAVPRGAVWPDLPEVAGPLVVKAQVPAGRRAADGGIRFAADGEEAGAEARRLAGRTVSGHEVAAVYVEEELAIERELYAAVLVDREAGAHTLVVSGEGGSEIEGVPATEILELTVDPLLGLRPFHTRRLAGFLDLDGDAAARFHDVMSALYAIALEEDATLVEVNPLALVSGPELVAADAKVSLDDAAAFRRTFVPELGPPAGAGGAAERVARAGASWVDIDPEGDVVAVVSGAGLLMATVDLLVDAGVAVRTGVDLKGTVLGDEEALERIFRVTAESRPGTTFVNAFLQVGSCERLARSLRTIREEVGLPGRLVARLAGRRSGPGREILAGAGFEVHEGLGPAIAALADGRGGDRRGGEG